MPTIGVISDTHGLLRPEAIRALHGVDRIVHAGDVGSRAVLDGLAAVAPTLAVRGNNDHGDFATGLRTTEVVETGSTLLYLLHDPADLDLDPVAAGFAAVVTGHSHRPSAETRDGVLHLNPGSAGPRRFHLPITLALLDVTASTLRPRFVDLAPR